jgi:hypothetical protein
VELLRRAPAIQNAGAGVPLILVSEWRLTTARVDIDNEQRRADPTVLALEQHAATRTGGCRRRHQSI